MKPCSFCEKKKAQEMWNLRRPMAAAEALAQILGRVSELLTNDDVAYITIEKLDALSPEVDAALRQYREAK